VSFGVFRVFRLPGAAGKVAGVAIGSGLWQLARAGPGAATRPRGFVVFVVVFVVVFGARALFEASGAPMEACYLV
jgi:hypothetical protein